MLIVSGDNEHEFIAVPRLVSGLSASTRWQQAARAAGRLGGLGALVLGFDEITHRVRRRR